MDHKEVIPALHQESNLEETEEEDKDEDEDGESMTTSSELVYTPLLPDEGEAEVDVDVEEMESLEEDEEACPLTPLLSYRERDNMDFSEDERQGCMPSVESGERKVKERKEEEKREEEAMEKKTDDEDSVLGLVIPLVSIVITQPTPEIEKRTLEGWLEEQEDEDDELVDLVAEDDDEENGDDIEEDKENIWANSKAGNATKPIRVGSNMELGEEAAVVPSIIVTPVTPELNQKIFGGGEVESDAREEEENEAKEEEIKKANPDSLEKSQVKSGISFSEDVKAEEDEKDDKGGARMKRRSSLFSTVTKATSILR